MGDTAMIEGDSGDYEVLEKAIEILPPDLEGLTCEVGLRRGYGSAVIMEAMAKRDCKFKVHIAIDPYGNIPYASHDDRVVRLDYTNSMRDETMPEMYKLAQQLGTSFIFYNLTDRDFFVMMHHGVPLYNIDSFLCNTYAMVHLDGPHRVQDLLEEVLFFSRRMIPGAAIVVDDVTYFDFELFNDFMERLGWGLHTKTGIKALFVKE